MALKTRQSEVITFSKRTIKALKPREKRYRVWDSEVRGLFCLIYPSGVKGYRLRYRNKGEKNNDVTHELNLGDALTYSDPEEVREIARKRKRQIGDSLNPKIVPIENKTNDYFNDLVEEWLSSLYYKDLADTTKRNTSFKLKSHLKPYFNQHRVKDITVIEVRNYYAHNLEKHSSNVANMNHRLLSSILTYAKDRDYIDINPCIGAIPKKLRQPDTKRYFELDNKILKKIDNGITAFSNSPRGNPYAYFLFRCIQFLGVRPNEIVSLRWSKDEKLKKLQNYVDLKNKVFVYEKIKNWNMIRKGHPKLVHIPDYLYALLVALPRKGNNPYVLPSMQRENDHYKKWNVSWGTVQSLGKFKLNLSDLRPVFITLANYEFGIENTSKYIGHSSVEMTEYYLKKIPERERHLANEFFLQAQKEYSR